MPEQTDPPTGPVPRFESEAEERAYWESHDSAEHLDWAQATRVTLPNLRPTSKAISLRLPISLLERIKVAAHKARRALPVADQGLAGREGRRAGVRERAGGPSRKAPYISAGVFQSYRKANLGRMPAAVYCAAFICQGLTFLGRVVPIRNFTVRPQS